MFDLTRTEAQWVTLAFVLIVTAIIIGYDVFACKAWGVEATISRVSKRLFTAYPTLFAAFVFWLGVLVGHIFLHTD